MTTIQQFAVALLSGGFLQWTLPKLWQWLRNAEIEISQETHIAVLRKALDRLGVRFNGVIGACDALTLAHEITKATLEEAQVEIPQAALGAVRIAREKLAEAVRVLESNGGA